MFTQESYQIYDAGHLIVCDCGRLCTFDQLVPGEIQEIPNPSCISCHSRHYHCPNCELVLVYDRGDKSPLELVHGSSHLSYDI